MRPQRRYTIQQEQRQCGARRPRPCLKSPPSVNLVETHVKKSTRSYGHRMCTPRCRSRGRIGKIARRKVRYAACVHRLPYSCTQRTIVNRVRSRCGQQCSPFPGIKVVLPLFLIKIGLVWESGMEVVLPHFDCSDDRQVDFQTWWGSLHAIVQLYVLTYSSQKSCKQVVLVSHFRASSHELGCSLY